MAAAWALCLAPALQAQPAPDFVTVTGSATYLQRIAMPPQAVLTVRVEDVSRADAKARVMAETREPFGGRQVPLAFALQVPRAAIDPRMRYALRATITVGDDLRFTTTQHVPVLTQGAANSADLLLAAVQPAAGSREAPATATLHNTYWKLVELDGQAVSMLPGQEREVRITLRSEGARLSGFSGCNPLMGGYVQDGQALQFTQLAGTLTGVPSASPAMRAGLGRPGAALTACPPPLDALERKVHQLLAATTGQRIEGQQLSLLQGEQVLARFEAVYL